MPDSCESCREQEDDNLIELDDIRSSEHSVLSGASMLHPLAGTIPIDEQLRLKKLIFRVSRGKAFV